MNKPRLEFVKLFLMATFSLLIGFLPAIDNFAHFGGLMTGFVCGLIFMPSIAFGKYDRMFKIGVVVSGIPITITFFVLVFKGYYGGGIDCPDCKYINCIPPMPWCELKCKRNIYVSIYNSI